MELKEIQQTIERKAGELGYTVDAPVRMNGRISRALGRVCFGCAGSKIYCKGIEFSTKYFENNKNSENTKYQIVLHELAHYLAFKTDGYEHAHDAVFREMCDKLGCYLTGEYAADSKEEIRNPVVKYNYELVCNKCGRRLRYYKRYTPSVLNKISGCCHAKMHFNALD